MCRRWDPDGRVGTLVCAIIGGAAGAWGAGMVGSEVGGQAGTFIYASSK